MKIGLIDKSEMKYGRSKKLNRVCCNDKSHNTYINSRGSECWYKHKCQKDTCTGYLCTNCYQKYDSNSCNNIMNSLRDHRTGNLDPNCNVAKGDNFEELTHIWKGADIISKKNDKYCGSLDHFVDSEGRIPQTKGRFYNSRNRLWPFTGFEAEWNKIFDYEICYCVSEDGKDIERIYEFPKGIIIKDKIKYISIVKNPMNTRGTAPIIPWYEEYRIKDIEILKKVNKIWKKIINGDL